MSAKITFTKPYYRWLFGGMGFHNSEATMTPLMSDELLNERILKTYRELSPTFSRVFAGFHDWTREAMDKFADYYHKTFALSDCSIYVVPGRLPSYCYESDERMAELAEEVAKRLKYLIEEKDCRLIRYYCVTNEMSVGNRYGRYSSDNALDRFKLHHKLLYDAFRRYGLDNVGLVATDTSGISSHSTVKWAVDNMDEITDVYCTHNYNNDGYDPFDSNFYKYFGEKMSEMVQLARKKEKRYLLGEFGIHNQRRQSSVMVPDVPDGFGKPEEEASTALAACAKALTAMNAGALATVYWSFVDYPDPFLPDAGHTPEAVARREAARFSGHGTSIRYNKNGIIHWTEDGDYNANAYLYSVGLLAKYFRKNSRLLAPESSDESILCGGVTNPDGSVSLSLINLSTEPRELEIAVEHEAKKPYRVYRYDSAKPPYNAFGDLQSCDGILAPDELKTRLEPRSMLVLTTDYVDRAPSAIREVEVSPTRISWQPSEDAEHCYYRVYEDGVQLGSTVAEYLERPIKPGAVYTVKSVDKYGNL